MKLFEPLDINGMVIPNRVMVPAMVTHLCREDGHVNQAIIDRYAAYAEGGAGLIVVEAMAIHQNKSGSLLRVSDDQFIPGRSCREPIRAPTNSAARRSKTGCA